MSGFIYQPLSSDFYTIPKAQILFQPKSSPQLPLEIIGDADNVKLDIKVTKVDRYTNEGGLRLLVREAVTQIDADLSMTLVQFSDRNRALSLLSDLQYETQTAAPGHVMTLTAPDFSQKIYMLDHMNVTNVVVTDDSIVPIVSVLNVDYKLDAKAGFIQLLNKHAGATANIVITYDAPVIVANDKIANLALGTKSENRGKVIIRGTNNVGPQMMLTLNDVFLRPAAARDYIVENSFDKLQIAGVAFRDPSQPPGFELGFERTIPQ